jgi:hypothetical protein
LPESGSFLVKSGNPQHVLRIGREPVIRALRPARLEPPMSHAHKGKGADFLPNPGQFVQRGPLFLAFVRIVLAMAIRQMTLMACAHVKFAVIVTDRRAGGHF